MLPKISYVILFGVISIATGKPTRDEGDSHYVKNERDLQKLLQSLTSQGKYKVASSYLNDGLNNHDDREGSSRFNDKPRQKYGQTNHYDNAEYSLYHQSRDNALEDSSSINSLQTINQLLQRHENKQASNPKHILIKDILSHDYNSYGKVKPNSERTENIDRLIALLDKLDANGNYARGINGNQKNVRNNLIYDETGASNSELPSSFSDPNSNSNKLAGRAERNLLDHIKYLLAQAKAGVWELIRNLIGINVRTNSNGNNRLRHNNDGDLTYKSKLRANKIKVNDDLDAVILELSDVEQLLRNLDSSKEQNSNKFTKPKLIEKVELQNLLSNRNSDDKKSNVEAVVFDLTQLENGGAVAKQIKRLLTQNNKGFETEYDDKGYLELDNKHQGLYELEKLVASQNKWLPAKSQPIKLPVKEQRQQKDKRAKTRVNNQYSPRIFRRNLMQDVGAPFSLEVQGLGQVNP